jgi:copper resistance protein C
MNFLFRKAIVALLLAGASAFVAFAHAILVKSMPAANEVVAGPNVPVELTFNSRVDQARSTLTLESPNHSTARLHPDADPSSPAKLTGRISNLAAGSYKLRWQVLAVDGHITRGEILFRVK